MRSGRVSDKREMTHNDHIGKELGEASRVQETIDSLQNIPGSETLEAVNVVDSTVEDVLDLIEDGIQNFHGTLDGIEVG